jgi:hypothetical protein
MKLKSPKDFWAGLMFIGFGLLFLIVARNYRMGSATSMGPAYFPTLLGGLTALLGGVLLFRSFIAKGPRVPSFSFRPLFFVILSLLLFGYLLKPIGVFFAVALLVLLSAYAGHEFKLKEAILLSLLMIAFSLLVFVLGLSLPFPLWPRFFS